MEKRMKDLVEYTKEKYGLNQYYLHRWDIIRSTTYFDDTVYTLSMEWFPNHFQDWDDDETNPVGTASIEIDIDSRKTKRVIFVGGVSYTGCLTFKKGEIIKWIEQETGLNYGKQFALWKEEERELHFRGRIDCFAIFPSFSIECNLNKEGQMTLFSVIGQYPSKNRVKQELFNLSLAQVEELTKEQLKLAEFPLMKKKKLVSAFMLEEIFIKNISSSTLPFADEKSWLNLYQVIEWEHQIQAPFHRKTITIDENITPEQAFRCEPHPDLQPITGEEIESCIAAIQTFLSQEYTSDSGKWIVKSLHRDKGYISATLKFLEQKERVFKRKMKLFIDRETYAVLNYMDNKPFLEMYMELKETDEIKVTKEEAFEKLKNLIELTPYYVYDFEEGCYVLCGKLDCHYAVKAHNGEVVELSEL